MDTPEKNHSGTSSLSKFEESPVFKFINGLSPIKPVKPIRIAQTFNSISFPSLPSIFSSPAISPLEELKSPTRRIPPDPVPSFKDVAPVSAIEGRVAVMDQLLENFVPNSIEEVKCDSYSAGDNSMGEGFCEEDDEGNREGMAEVLIFNSPMISEGVGALIPKPFQTTGLCTSVSHSNSTDDNRGTRRRCLDFATADDGSMLCSSSSSSSTRCALPGIGLHLNALAIRLKDQKPSNSGNLSSDLVEEPLMSSPTAEKKVDTDENPMNNRQWMENPAKSESCKRCNCKKSRCLKLYCECFAAGVYCIEPCSCQDCFNKPIHEDVVLETRRQIESRNPLAFAPKVIVNSDLVSDPGDDSNKTPAPARHKRGCNCKKSSCLKKYCECFQGGVGCSDNCRCEGCKNAFGRKDELALIGAETEQEEEQRERLQENADDRQNPSCRRSLIPLPFQLKRKLPYSYIDDRCSSRLSVRFKLEKQSISQTQAKVEDEEIRGIVGMDFGCGRGIKSVSPNSKRVTAHPPASGRIGRKLILQSVPCFPSLSPQKLRVNGPSKL